MKRFSILSLVVLLLFAVQFAFADNGDEEPLPPNYSFNDCVTTQMLGGSNPVLPDDVQESIPSSYWDSHSGYLSAEVVVYSSNTNDVIGTTASARFLDGLFVDNMSVSYEGHSGSDSDPISTNGIDTGSWFKVSMYQALGYALPTCGALSEATINIWND